jgi:hypothetical protein
MNDKRVNIKQNNRLIENVYTFWGKCIYLLRKTSIRFKKMSIRFEIMEYSVMTRLYGTDMIRAGVAF